MKISYFIFQHSSANVWIIYLNLKEVGTLNNPKYIEIVVNLKSNASFIMIDAFGTRLQLIAPNGKIVSLPEDLFEDEPNILEAEQFEKKLTPEQINAFNKLQLDDEKEAQQRAIEKSRKIKADAVAAERVSQTSTARSPNSPPKKRKPKVDTRTGIISTWNAPRLSFYRNKIEPLGPRQSFIITVANAQYQMTRAQFENIFNEVVMSASYRRDGLFTYESIPDKAEQFKK